MTAHDVRRLGTCAVCSGFGMHGDGLLLIGFKADARGRRRGKQFAHARCYIDAVDLAKLILLPDEELNRVRLCDVTKEEMQAILAAGRARTPLGRARTAAFRTEQALRACRGNPRDPSDTRAWSRACDRYQAACNRLYDALAPFLAREARRINRETKAATP